MYIISILAEESNEKIRRIEDGIEMKSSIPFQFKSIPFCDSNSNSMASNSNSNSGIDPNPESDRQLDIFHLYENHKILPAFYRNR